MNDLADIDGIGNIGQLGEIAFCRIKSLLHAQRLYCIFQVRSIAGRETRQPYRPLLVLKILPGRKAPLRKPGLQVLQ
ncbi:hypothetical protein D3C73_1190370 [compost metagenome]